MGWPKLKEWTAKPGPCPGVSAALHSQANMLAALKPSEGTRLCPTWTGELAELAACMSQAPGLTSLGSGLWPSLLSMGRPSRGVSKAQEGPPSRPGHPHTHHYGAADSRIRPGQVSEHLLSKNRAQGAWGPAIPAQCLWDSTLGSGEA